MASPAVELGLEIRTARKLKGLTIAQLASQIGRPREWLNRVELGYSEYGEHKPPTQTDLRGIVRYIGDEIAIPIETLMQRGKAVEAEYQSLRHNAGRTGRVTHGRLAHTDIILGEDQVTEAILDLIRSQEPDAVLRNTGVRDPNNSIKSSGMWSRYRQALGEFLTNNPNGLFKRVEYVQNWETLEVAKQSDAFLAGKLDLKNVHNAKVKFRTANPFLLHILIGQHEAIFALPQIAGQQGSNMAIYIRDKQFVDAMRVWYDEVLWEGTDTSQMVKFHDFDQSFLDIAKMYDFKIPGQENQK